VVAVALPVGGTEAASVEGEAASGEVAGAEDSAVAALVGAETISVEDEEGVEEGFGRYIFTIRCISSLIVSFSGGRGGGIGYQGGSFQDHGPTGYGGPPNGQGGPGGYGGPPGGGYGGGPGGPGGYGSSGGGYGGGGGGAGFRGDLKREGHGGYDDRDSKRPRY
jgi:hypothetical protein